MSGHVARVDKIDIICPIHPQAKVPHNFGDCRTYMAVVSKGRSSPKVAFISWTESTTWEIR